ncbi:hypothetical protein FQA39_LY07344 [Lamprigera yunnana]|nr:hypothetical protein FQA39_LY07344 [Lamprigera yunnana]
MTEDVIRDTVGPEIQWNIVLKSYFQCLLKDWVLHYKPQKAAKIINVDVVLYNILRPEVHEEIEVVAEVDIVTEMENIDAEQNWHYEGMTCDMMWKQRQIGSKTLTFEMIEEKKILRIEDMCGNESVSDVWSLETVLSYIFSYFSASNFKHFYDDVIRAEMSGDANTNIYKILNRLPEKSDIKCVKYSLLKNMWTLYAKQHWTKAIDLKSAVQRLYEELSALEFDADDEATYAMEKYYTVEQCEQLRDKYKIERKCIKDRLSKIGLQHFLDTINKYISNSDTSDEKEYKAVEQIVRVQRRQKKNQRKAKVKELLNQFHSLKMNAKIVSTKFYSLFCTDYCDEMVNKFSKGIQICRKFIKGHFCFKCLQIQLFSNNLEEYL